MPAPISRWRPGEPAQQRPPRQERGRKPARALPYGPSFSARLDRQGRLDLKLHNRGSQAAHFALYPYAGELPLPAHVDVERSHSERIALPGDAYKLAIQGPNRLWYELAGSKTGAAARVDVRPGVVAYRTVLALELDNAGDERLDIRLLALGFGTRAVSYRLRPGTTRTVNWDTDQGWFDVEVTVLQYPSFRRRLTGRVENGRPGVTP